MQRLKPDPIPAIRPCPEHLADARLAAVYADTKSVLGVPWMGVVTMAFAHYPAFYGCLWSGLRAMCGTTAFDDACANLRAHVESQVLALQPRALAGELQALGYTMPELAQIRGLIEVFSAGNQPYVLIATLARMLLEDEDFSSSAQAQPANVVSRRTPQLPALTLIEPHHAEAQTAALYLDIQQTLGLPFVNTDYRALARWPSYFAPAWQDLRPHIASPHYAAHVLSAHDKAVEQARGLALPAQLTGKALREAADRDASTAQILAVVRLFQWLLPGLITNVAFLRAQLLQGH